MKIKFDFYKQQLSLLNIMKMKNPPPLYELALNEYQGGFCWFDSVKNIFQSAWSLSCCHQQALDKDHLKCKLFACMLTHSMCWEEIKWVSCTGAYVSLEQKAHWCCCLCQCWTNLVECAIQGCFQRLCQWSHLSWKIQVCQMSKGLEISQMGIH